MEAFEQDISRMLLVRIRIFIHRLHPRCRQPDLLLINLRLLIVIVCGYPTHSCLDSRYHWITKICVDLGFAFI